MFEGRKPDIAEENVQARIRGTLLMAFSNKFNSLLLTTGNKSELATGYCTLYGDMSGGLAVIGDLLKVQVYALARSINARCRLIPEAIIDKAPIRGASAGPEGPGLPPALRDPRCHPGAVPGENKSAVGDRGERFRRGAREVGDRHGGEGGIQETPGAPGAEGVPEGLRDGTAHPHREEVLARPPRRPGAPFARAAAPPYPGADSFG